MLEVNYICRIITKYFRLKARPWQVCILIDIIYKKTNFYAIASTNTSKSLVYQTILVITGLSYFTNNYSYQGWNKGLFLIASLNWILTKLMYLDLAHKAIRYYIYLKKYCQKS